VANIFRAPTFWAKQPPNNVGVNFGNPTTIGLLDCINFAVGTAYNNGNNANGAVVGVPPITQCEEGVGPKTGTGSTNHVNSAPTTNWTTYTQSIGTIRFCFWAGPTWVNTYNTIFGRSTGTYASSDYFLAVNASGLVNWLVFSTVSVAPSPPLDIGLRLEAYNELVIVARGTYNSNAYLEFYVNGVSRATYALNVGNSVPAVTAPIKFGSWDGASGFGNSVGLIPLQFQSWKRSLSDAEIQRLAVRRWSLFAPLQQNIFPAGGPAPVTGTGKAVGGGVVKADGTHAGQGAGAAVGGGVARSSGTAAKVGAGAAVGGGVARAAGSGSTSPTGTGKAVGGGTAAATGAATKAGVGRAVGGGVARASGFGIRSGTAIAVGGGVAKAAGGVVIPSVVDHYVKGWPVAASGAVIVHLVP